MKKFTNLLIVCSLAMAGAVMAQQPTPEQSQPPSKKQAPPKQAPQKQAPAATHTPKPQAPATTTAPATTKQEKHAPPTHTQSPAAAVTPAPDKHAAHNDKHTKANTSPSATAAAKTTATPAAKTTPSPAEAKTTATPATAKTTATPAAAGATTTPAAKMTATPAATAATTPKTAASASTAPAVSPANSPATANAAAAAKKPDPQKVQQIQQQHASFRAEPRPDRVPPVTFSAGFRLPGAEHWQGPQYEVYRSYHPERHDQGWYHSHYQRVELVAGGYYYFNNGYWYPAWGYNQSHEYYAYDAPIYVGHHSEPPDKVIANVQAALQDMGYYKGEVDGLLGPLTREALTAYQTDNGMQVTAVIDEPTLDSLNMG